VGNFFRFKLLEQQFVFELIIQFVQFKQRIFFLFKLFEFFVQLQ
jgi:hypothetical protein